jgi:hypothetical protein
VVLLLVPALVQVLLQAVVQVAGLPGGTLAQAAPGPGPGPGPGLHQVGELGSSAVEGKRRALLLAAGCALVPQAECQSLVQLACLASLVSAMAVAPPGMVACEAAALHLAAPALMAGTRGRLQCWRAVLQVHLQLAGAAAEQAPRCC